MQSETNDNNGSDSDIGLLDSSSDMLGLGDLGGFPAEDVQPDEPLGLGEIPRGHPEIDDYDVFGRTMREDIEGRGVED